MIETAKENRLDPYRYLLWVLNTAPELAQQDSAWAVLNELRIDCADKEAFLVKKMGNRFIVPPSVLHDHSSFTDIQELTPELLRLFIEKSWCMRR